MENVCCEVERDHCIWPEQRNIYDFAPKFQLKMDSFKCSLTHNGNHFFWQSMQKVGGDQLKGKKTIFKRFVGIRKMEKPPLARPFLHRHLHQSRPDQTRIVVPAIRLLQWLTTSYGGQQKMKKTSKREGSGLAGTAKK